MPDASRSMTKGRYRELRHRYRQARRDDARRTTMNASEWRRGVHADLAGAIRASAPADVAATLDRPAPAACPVGERLRAALSRQHGRQARASAAQQQLQTIAAAMAQSRALDGRRREEAARHG